MLISADSVEWYFVDSRLPLTAADVDLRRPAQFDGAPAIEAVVDRIAVMPLYRRVLLLGPPNDSYGFPISEPPSESRRSGRRLCGKLPNCSYYPQILVNQVQQPLMHAFQRRCP